MFDYRKPLFFNCETNVHPGAGTSIGYIDNVIQREKSSHTPVIRGQSLKGSLRHNLLYKDLSKKETIDFLFGPDNGNEASGNISFREARVLFLPVACSHGTLRYITCMRELRKLRKVINEEIPELELINYEEIIPMKNINSRKIKHIFLGTHDAFTITDYEGNESDDLVAHLSPRFFRDEDEQEYFTSRAVIVHDDVFRYYVRTQLAVEQRNRINPFTGVVEGTALFTSENIPSDSLLIGEIASKSVLSEEYEIEKEASEVYESLIALLKIPGQNENRFSFELGGDKTSGHGIITMTYHIPDVIIKSDKT